MNQSKIKLFTATQIAELLQISKSSVRRYGRDGTLGTVQIGGKGSAVRYYIKEDIHG